MLRSVTVSVIVLMTELLFFLSSPVPLQVVGVYVRKIDNIIEWLPSSSVHGPIVGYEVQLFSPEAEGKINSVDQYTVMYMVNVTRDLPSAGQPVNVRVSGCGCRVVIEYVIVCVCVCFDSLFVAFHYDNHVIVCSVTLNIRMCVYKLSIPNKLK